MLDKILAAFLIASLIVGGQGKPEKTRVTTTEKSGVETTTRVFIDPNSRVHKVIVTTRDDVRTTKVTSRQGEILLLPDGKVPDPLTASSDALADAVGFAKRGEQAAPEPADHADEQREDLRQSKETDRRLRKRRKKSGR